MTVRIIIEIDGETVRVDTSEPSDLKPGCKVCHWLLDNPDKAEKLESLLRNPTITYTDISLTEEMRGIERRIISRHARGVCSSGKVYRK